MIFSVFLIFIMVMSVATMLSFLHMHSLSKPLEKLGLHTNSKLMKLYVFIWGWLGIISAVFLYLVLSLRYHG